MKEKKQNIRIVIGIIVFTVILIYLVNNIGLVGRIIKMIWSLLFPFVLGCGIAFVINIPMRSIEKSVFKNEKGRLYRWRRVISMFLAYLMALLVILLVIFVVVPEVADTIASIKDKLPGFIEDAKKWLLRYTEKFPEITRKIDDFEPDFSKIGSLFVDNGSTIITTTVSVFSSIIGTIINVLVGIVFSFYILFQKEKMAKQLKMVCYAIFKEDTADELMVFGKIANITFSKFFSCQFREGIILGAMFMIVMMIFGFPYPLTVGVLIAFTAMIPVFGSFI